MVLVEAVEVVALEELVGELRETHTLPVHTLLDTLTRGHLAETEVDANVTQEGDHGHVTVEGVVVQEGKRWGRGERESGREVGIEVSGEVVELFFEF